ncbi:MAG TPA: chemotaxis protein CheW [Gemmatimonadaceae bacterium]|nr:chemotaxis protein CheW [Gemmatimonadaceae bacterium]
MHLLLFTLDSHRFALPLDRVREIVHAVEITPLAGAPGVVEGVVDVRGAVVPVLDVRARFRLPARPVRLSDHLVLAEGAGRLVALRVDRAVGTDEVPPEAVTMPGANDPAMAHLAGVVTLDDGMVLVHDLDAFLSQAEADALARALATEAAA